MQEKRECNYDLLKVVSMVAVIMIHISATWIEELTRYVADGGKISELVNPVMACIYNSISRFAVPSFIMVSGAFVLDSSRTLNYREFYKKRVLKIGIPTVVFSILYILYRILFGFAREQIGLSNLIDLIRDIVSGSPFYHMWYLYMIIGVYLMAPIVMRFKNSISYGNFRKTVLVFLILASVSRWTTEKIRLSWDLGQSFEYLGYFMMGFVIRKDLQKNNLNGILLIMLGAAVEIATAFVEYKFQIVGGIMESDLKFQIVSPYCPTIVLASLLIFAGFTKLQIRYNQQIEKLADMSFFVYLFHAGVWDFFGGGVLKHLTKGKADIVCLNNIYWIPIFVAIVFMISIALTNFYKYLELYFLRRRRKK